MKYISKSLKDTNTIASSILKRKPENINLIVLIGELASGKTQLVKEIAKNLKIKELITSPSYGLKREYDGLIHYDLFFFEGKKYNKLVSTIYEDAEENLVFIEWGEKIPRKYFQDYIEIKTEFITETVKTYEFKIHLNSNKKKKFWIK